MRYRTEPEQVTRLLLQKPSAHAEVDENARIALSVLGDDGWKVERVALEWEVTVRTIPIDGAAEAQASLDAAIKTYEELRKLYLGSTSVGWFMMACGLAAGGAAAHLGISGSAYYLSVAAALISIALRYVNRMKGAA